MHQLTEEALTAAIDDLRRRGVSNVLALRGDVVSACDPSPFKYAKDLIMRLADEGFCIGAAAYPEGHIECTDFKASVAHLKQKQDAGASFFVTQLFFDNQYYYRFREAAERAHVTVPITCGIMPFLSKAQIQRMVFMCGAAVSHHQAFGEIRKRSRFPAVGRDRVRVRAAGRSSEARR